MEEEKSNQNGGPRTDEGKQTSRLNALKHGLTANLLSRYDDFDYDSFLDGLKEELKPMTLLEEIIIERMAVNYLRIIRANKMERNLIESTVNPRIRWEHDSFEFVGSHKTTNSDGEELIFEKEKLEYMANIFNRYYISAENRFYRALKEFREIREQPLISINCHQ